MCIRDSANTDWYDYYFKKASIRHSHHLSVTGGSDKLNYYVGLGYIYQEGLLEQVDDNLSKYNVNSKFQIRANKWLKFNFNNNLSLNILCLLYTSLPQMWTACSRSAHRFGR